MNRKDMKIGDVFSFKGDSIQFVFYGSQFEEWYNTGGMGEYTYFYISLDSLIAMGDVKDTEELKKYIYRSKDQSFLSKIEINKTEAPFEITSRTAVLYSVRRKTPKTITIYE